MLKIIFLPWLVIRDLRHALNGAEHDVISARRIASELRDAMWEDEKYIIRLQSELATLRNPPRNAAGKFAKRAA